MEQARMKRGNQDVCVNGPAKKPKVEPVSPNQPPVMVGGVRIKQEPGVQVPNGDHQPVATSAVVKREPGVGTATVIKKEPGVEGQGSGVPVIPKEQVPVSGRASTKLLELWNVADVTKSTNRESVTNDTLVTTPRNISAIVFSRYNRRGIKCSYCKERFWELPSLLEHSWRAHGLCSTRCRRLDEARGSSLHTVTNVNPATSSAGDVAAAKLQCIFCSNNEDEYECRKALYDHVLITHHSTSPFRCHDCTVVFAPKFDFFECDNNAFRVRCVLCCVGFPNQAELRWHCGMEHVYQGFGCGICKLKMNKAGRVRMTSLSAVNTQGNVPILQRGRGTRRKFKAAKKTVKCPSCRKRFKQYEHMFQHMEMVHCSYL